MTKEIAELEVFSVGKWNQDACAPGHRPNRNIFLLCHCFQEMGKQILN